MFADRYYLICKMYEIIISIFIEAIQFTFIEVDKCICIYY